LLPFPNKFRESHFAAGAVAVVHDAKPFFVFEEVGACQAVGTNLVDIFPCGTLHCFMKRAFLFMCRLFAVFGFLDIEYATCKICWHKKRSSGLFPTLILTGVL